MAKSFVRLPKLLTIHRLFIFNEDSVVKLHMCLGNMVVSLMDSHSCDRGSSPGQDNHINVMLGMIFRSYQLNLLPSWYYIYKNK